MNGFPNYGSYFNPFASPQYMNGWHNYYGKTKMH